MSETADRTTRFCPTCKGSIEADSRFCKHCAFDLTTNSVFPNASTVNTEIRESGKAARYRHTYLKPMLVVGAVVSLIVLVAVAFVLYKRNRAQASQVALTAASFPTMSSRAIPIEEKILRGEALNDNDLANLSAYELRVLRNVHFARYGRKYEQPGLGDYFFTRPWYKVSETYTDTVLTATDKANINLIVQAEKQIDSSKVASTSSISNTTSSQTTVTTTTSNSPADRLTNGNVEEAVRQMLSNLTQGGSVIVQGVQELPQENAAVADLVFNQFKYAADQFGTPVAASKYRPKPLPRDRIPTPEEMFQPRLRTYSGNGRAVLKHYNNNQWTLKQVNWGGMGIGWQGNVVVR